MTETIVIPKNEVLAQECPLCDAKPGKPCRAISRAREVVALHCLRAEAAYAARQSQGAPPAKPATRVRVRA